MAIKVKSAGDSAKKFAAKGAAAGADYKAGIQNPKRDYAESTAAAEGSYASGVNQAIADGRFGKGVRAAGNEKWRRKAENVGAQRFPQGVQQAEGDYSKGVQPYLETIAGLTLPARGPKGDPSNVSRVTAVASALRARKLQG